MNLFVFTLLRGWVADHTVEMLSDKCTLVHKTKDQNLAK